MRHLRSVAYSVELVPLNKHQIWGGAPKLDCYRWLQRKVSEESMQLTCVGATANSRLWSVHKTCAVDVTHLLFAIQDNRSSHVAAARRRITVDRCNCPSINRTQRTILLHRHSHSTAWYIKLSTVTNIGLNFQLQQIQTGHWHYWRHQSLNISLSSSPVCYISW